MTFGLCSSGFLENGPVLSATPENFLEMWIVWSHPNPILNQNLKYRVWGIYVAFFMVNIVHILKNLVMLLMNNIYRVLNIWTMSYSQTAFDRYFFFLPPFLPPFFLLSSLPFFLFLFSLEVTWEHWLFLLIKVYSLECKALFSWLKPLVVVIETVIKQFIA